MEIQCIMRLRAPCAGVWRVAAWMAEADSHDLFLDKERMEFYAVVIAELLH